MSSESLKRPSFSVIIPTHNRSASLRATLESIGRQKYLSADFEVIVVDDGSIDETPQIASLPFPFKLVYLAQPWSGATVARNFGAQHSRSEILVFQDDDIELLPVALSPLIEMQASLLQIIVIGNLLESVSTFCNDSIDKVRNEWVHFRSCHTGLLCVKRADFLALGMFQDPTHGWPNWDDIDFGYRAQAAGYQILRVGSAAAIHHNLAALNLENAAHREYQASKSAVRLFQKYPEIRSQLPMYADKTPIDWQRDMVGLIVRKLLRRITATRLALVVMQHSIQYLEHTKIVAGFMRRLKRWYVRAYMVLGYLDGLSQYGPAEH